MGVIWKSENLDISHSHLRRGLGLEKSFSGMEDVKVVKDKIGLWHTIQTPRVKLFYNKLLVIK